jgi:hypothetical protein
MLLVDEAFRRAELDFSERAVAITLPGSELDRTAAAQGWLVHLVPIGRRSTTCRVPGTLFGQRGKLIGPAALEEMIL